MIHNKRKKKQGGKKPRRTEHPKTKSKTEKISVPYHLLFLVTAFYCLS
jgi:hypothetical protein